MTCWPDRLPESAFSSSWVLVASDDNHVDAERLASSPGLREVKRAWWSEFSFENVLGSSLRFRWTGLGMDLSCQGFDLGDRRDSIRVAEALFLARNMSFVELTIGEGDCAGKITSQSDELPPSPGMRDMRIGERCLTIEPGERLEAIMCLLSPLPDDLLFRARLVLHGKFEKVGASDKTAEVGS